MKKITVLVLFLVCLSNSCSKSDDSSSGDSVASEVSNKITVKIDGLDREFTSINVDDSDPNLIQVEVSVPNSSNSEAFSFSIDRTATGVDGITNFSYTKPTGPFYNSFTAGSVFSSNTTVNNETTFKATFNGTLKSTTSSNDLILENGNISITY